LTTFLFANDNPKYHLQFGFLYKGTILSSFKDARSTLTKWITDTAYTDNGDVTVTYYADSESLYKEFKEDKLDMIILSLDYFFRNKDEIKKISNDYWTLTTKKEKFIQLYLLAIKDSNINSVKDIRNKTISIKEEDDSSKIWLDKESLSINKKPYKKVLKSVKYTSKKSTGILNVFFNKTDLAVVPKDTWETMIELNPAVKKKVKVIAKSEKINIPFIALFSKNANKIGKDSFFTFSKDGFDLAGGKQIASLLKYDTFYWLKQKDLKNLEVYFDEYFALEKKYK